MTTFYPSDAIDRITPTVQGAYTMKGPEEVLTMKTLHAKGHSPLKIAKLLGCSHHTVLRYVRNGFDAAPRELRYR
ncbi:MAG: helix-turn-helix domain-containing protein [Gammaproteobacteria bacterium]|nr:helix-turn-helix domain-containing protein [Gammaproteobacteria bacterium]